MLIARLNTFRGDDESALADAEPSGISVVHGILEVRRSYPTNFAALSKCLLCFL